MFVHCASNSQLFIVSSVNSYSNFIKAYQFGKTSWYCETNLTVKIYGIVTYQTKNNDHDFEKEKRG